MSALTLIKEWSSGYEPESPVWVVKRSRQAKTILTLCKNTCNKILVNQDNGVFTRCMHKESGLWCFLFGVKMISAPGGILKLFFFFKCVCMYLASGTAICVRDVEPEDVNVRLLWPRCVVLLHTSWRRTVRWRKATHSSVPPIHSLQPQNREFQTSSNP